ncbi:tyrosine-type recombinase/integrase [Oceanomicrobium pacificus]|uniref:Tyrosine-type recombinase/integrase n=1 Tax=Oceanomicrobium pacificus TaxID=2692916 RepID=A0A6B0TPS7_9RHOB|nr:tyrosine-type recombinase/integrase [Oceanomicrobium pacificus]MXU65926.1 tyrosine-type recombinase/integrase [Oceanomicrobium pacificus]
MARPVLKYVWRMRDRHGKERVYLRYPRRPLIALPALPETSLEFQEAYRVAMLKAENGTMLPSRSKEGTIGEILDLTMKSHHYRTGITDLYRKRLRGHFDAIRESVGHVPFDVVRVPHIRKNLSHLSDRPHEAEMRLKAWRFIFAEAVKASRADQNFASDVPWTTVKNKGFPSWSEEEISAYEDHWKVGTPQRTAFDLLLHTGQRRKDICEMEWSDIKDGWITIIQSKTKKQVDIPISHALQASLDVTPKIAATIITTKFGKPRSSNAFGEWFRSSVKEAGIKDRSAHGLRKAAANRLAEAGCSVHEIASITGHTSLKEVERYTKSASQRRMAQKAMQRLDK